MNFSLRRRYFLFGLLGSLLYFLSKSKYQKSFDTKIPNVGPVVVWEYITDFSNMKHLNPTLIDFQVVSESNSLDVWRYAIEYTEYLSNLPFITNKAYAEFEIRQVSDNYYLIDSKHETCFLGKYLCLNSVSKFTFSLVDNKDTLCQEEITYECPRGFKWFCDSEADFQRQAISNNLLAKFK